MRRPAKRTLGRRLAVATAWLWHLDALRMSLSDPATLNAETGGTVR